MFIIVKMEILTKIMEDLQRQKIFQMESMHIMQSIDAITGEPQFPYFIGNSFRSNTIDENQSLNQKFDFNNSSLSRNTLGYKILEKNASNDFIIENDAIKQQK